MITTILLAALIGAVIGVVASLVAVDHVLKGLWR